MLNGMKPRFSGGFASLVDCGDDLASSFCSSDRDAPFLSGTDDDEQLEDDDDEFNDGDNRYALLPEAPAALLSLLLGEVASRLVSVLFFFASEDGVECNSLVARELLFESVVEERLGISSSQSESSLSLPEFIYGTRLVDEDLAPLLDVVAVLEETIFTDFSGTLLSPLLLLAWLLFNSQEGLWVNTWNCISKFYYFHVCFLRKSWHRG